MMIIGAIQWQLGTRLLKCYRRCMGQLVLESWAIAVFGRGMLEAPLPPMEPRALSVCPGVLGCQGQIRNMRLRVALLEGLRRLSNRIPDPLGMPINNTGAMERDHRCLKTGHHLAQRG